MCKIFSIIFRVYFFIIKYFQFSSQNIEDFLKGNPINNFKTFNSQLNNEIANLKNELKNKDLKIKEQNPNNNYKSFNNQLNDEIANLKNELKIKDQKIKEQNSLINDLKNQLNIINNNSQVDWTKIIEQKEKEIKVLKEELLNKKNEISDLKESLNNNSNSILQGGKPFAISFESVDSKIKYPIICTSNTIISRLEEEIYNEYPEYKELNTYLTCNGLFVKRFKTINENGIKKGNSIIVNIYE